MMHLLNVFICTWLKSRCLQWLCWRNVLQANTVRDVCHWWRHHLWCGRPCFVDNRYIDRFRTDLGTERLIDLFIYYSYHIWCTVNKLRDRVNVFVNLVYTFTNVAPVDLFPAKSCLNTEPGEFVVSWLLMAKLCQCDDGFMKLVLKSILLLRRSDSTVVSRIIPCHHSAT